MTTSPSLSQGFNARRVHRAFDRLLEAFLKPHGFKTGYWYYLRVLWMEDSVSQRRLSEMNNVTENTTTAIVGAMVRDGLVERNPDPTDGRACIITLSPRAVALRESLLPYAARINAIAAEGIDEAELATCLKVMKSMAANLEAAYRKLEAPQAPGRSPRGPRTPSRRAARAAAG